MNNEENAVQAELGNQAADTEVKTSEELIDRETSEFASVAGDLSEVEQTLEVRGSRYGSFLSNSNFTEEVNTYIRAKANRLLANAEKAGIYMIVHKLSRIICGTGTVKDNPHDIAGYAVLVMDQVPLEGEYITNSNTERYLQTISLEIEKALAVNTFRFELSEHERSLIGAVLADLLNAVQDEPKATYWTSIANVANSLEAVTNDA